MKTAVEWLVEKFNQCEPMYSGIQSLEHKQYLDDLIKQAKAMEKEQMEEMYEHAMLALVDGNGHGEGFDEYYNKTFKSE